MFEHRAAHLGQIGVPEEAKQPIQAACLFFEQEAPEALEHARSSYRNRADWNGIFETFHREIAPLQAKEYTANLVLLLFLLDELKRRYQSLGYEDAIFEETVKDIGYKVQECRLVYGVLGIFPYEWYAGIYDPTTFALGRLQFQKRPSPCSFPGFGVKQGDLVISIHIPRDGTRLEKKRCLESIARAKEFFRKDLGFEPKFVCVSWILHPNVTKRLKKGSNLAEFASMFDVVSRFDDEDYHQLWRVFDCEITREVLQSLPRGTSLENALANLVESKETFGEGIGILQINCTKN